MERNSYSILAKLMGIDKVSPPHTTHERRRVLSENYLQNIASVVRSERSPLDLDVDDFSMAVDGHPESQDTVEVSEGSQKDNASLNITRVNSSLRNKVEEMRFLPQNQRFELFGRFDLRGSTNPCSRLGQLTVPGSSCASSDKTGCFRPNISKENDYYIPAKRISEQNKQGRKCNGIKSPMQGPMLPHEIAKQITSQVKNSVWHSCSELSRSGSTSDNSSLNEHEEIMSSSSCLSELENKHEAPSSDASVKSANHETRNMKKRLCEKWRTRKYSQDRRTSHGRETKGKLFGINFNARFTSGDVNGSQVVAASARYLSKPMLFPSAWVPRSRSRHFTLDKNWSLRPTEKNFGHKDLRSTYEPSDLTTLDSQGDPSTPKDSQILEEQNVCEEISSAQGSFDGSVFSDVENPISHEVQIMLNENGDKLSEEHISQKENVAPLSLNCSFAPVNVDSELVAGEENEKTVKSMKFKREQLSAEPSTCLLLEDRGSNLQDFCSKNQLKDNAVFEPGSPVSSLEGPEACMHLPNSTVEPEEIPSVPECFKNDIHGLQKKLQSIETVSLESGSEGPGMMVSSDDGDVSCYHEDAQLIEIHSLSETRDFSYLVDVLTESGCLTMDLEMDTEPYDVLTPSLFKLLEEKYGEQTFWERCERRLLFDRINCGLKEIMQPFVGINTWKKCVVKRYDLFTRGSQESIEEQLWAALVNQEEESKSESSSDKLCQRETEWLELDEDIGLLVHELEFFLIDELVEDFVNLEITHGVVL